MTPRDVVVVGAGPAGAATAILLRSRGHDVLLLDSARFPRDKICGEGISPGAWPLLDAIGAAAAVRRLAPYPLRGMTLTAPDGTVVRGTYRDVPCPGFALRRRDLDAALAAVAREADVEMREGARVVELLRRDGHVAGVVDADGAAIPARLVIGADGRRSVVARKLGLLREHRRLRKFAVRGYWDGVQGLEERGEMHVARAGYCGVAPLSPTSANVAFVVDRREMPAAGGDLEAFYRRTLARWPRLLERLGRAALREPPRAIGPLALDARRLSWPGMLLVGDAAGFYDPFTGEGVTLALRSAALAAEVGSAALGAGRLDRLGAYDRARHTATRDKFRLNRLLQHVIAWPSLANATAHRLARRPDLADRLVGIAGDFVPARSAFDARFLWDLLTA